MPKINFNVEKAKAIAAQKMGGSNAEWAKVVMRMLARIHEIESEAQEARQLKLFGDVKPPPKTPIGV
jgi:hypothetical protein